MQTEKEYLSARDVMTLRCESAAEYSLPDYNGDVKKVLTVKTKAFPAGKFVGEDLLEFSGSVTYEVVYLDGENNVTHAEFSSGYDGAVRINPDTYVDSDVFTSVSGCNMRLVGPRKICVKSTLDNEIRISERKRYEINGDAFDEYEPETSVKTVNVSARFFGSVEADEITEEILSIEGAIADEVEILLSDAEFIPGSIEKKDNEVEVKGSIRVTLLYRNADEKPRIVTKDIAFDEEIELEGAGSLDALDIRVDLTSLKTGVEPTEDGVSLVVTLVAVPVAYGIKNTGIEVVRDAYLKERGTSNDYSEFGYTEHICTETYEEKFELKRPASELGIEDIGEIIWAESAVRSEKCDFDEKGVKIDGEIKFSGIACKVSEDGTPSYYPIKFTASFSQNVNVSCQKHDNMRIDCSVRSMDTKMEFTENDLYACATICTLITINSQRRQRCLGSSFLTDEEYSRDESIITVYYPEPSETLFEIAKRFHTSVYAIAETNRLTENVFASSDEGVGTSDVKKLIIK